MMRFLKTVFIYLLCLAFSYALLIILLSLPQLSQQRARVPEDVLFRRSFLVEKLINHDYSDYKDSDNFEFKGEYAMGTHAMASYALTNIAMLDPSTAQESSRIIAQLIKICLTRRAYEFDERNWGEDPLDEKVLQGDNGHIGYYGHLNLMLGAYGLLNPDGQFKELHQKLSDALARRLKKHPHRQAETYPGQSYPPDNTVVAASLRIADKIYGERYKEVIDEWVQETKKLEVKPYGLIPFLIDPATGAPTISYRGANLSWNSFFLPLVDADYAREQFVRFKKYMLVQWPGLAAFREFSHDVSWISGDRDSGPVIFGLSAGATVMAIAGSRWEGNARLTADLLRLMELAGISVTKGDQRRYITAPLVGDAVALAMRTACPWEPLWRKN